MTTLTFTQLLTSKPHMCMLTEDVQLKNGSIIVALGVMSDRCLFLSLSLSLSFFKRDKRSAGSVMTTLLSQNKSKHILSTTEKAVSLLFPVIFSTWMVHAF